MTEQWPMNGADSDWQPRPFRVYLVHLYEDRRKWVTVNGCIGPNDAKNHGPSTIVMPTEVGGR